MRYIKINNFQAVAVTDIPETEYDSFYDTTEWLITDHPERHCINYFGYDTGSGLKLIMCIADDNTHDIYVTSCRPGSGNEIKSMTVITPAFEKYEREIYENFGLFFTGHPWLKPLRYPASRHNKNNTIANYPFFQSDSEELHEVGVGPIHAGVIEPGHFRFICNGEKILHLEIQLGYQHRGVEKLFTQRKNVIQKIMLAEGIAGDSAAAHTVTFSNLWESLCGFKTTPELDFNRTLSLELERIAIHTGDMSAVCTDIAYQMGSAVLGRLRTPIINFTQEWCGNRLGKSLNRPFIINYPFTAGLALRLNQVLDNYIPDFDEITNQIFRLTSVLSRFERTGVINHDDMLSIGGVGMAARASGLARDIRQSHPYNLYKESAPETVIKNHGDVYSRVQVRREEIEQSIGYVRSLIQRLPEHENQTNHYHEKPMPGLFVAGLTEGWRGEVCHCAITDNDGELVIYKIKDPSFHNWSALALAVRNNEISDFPICNKSFNLSYCGHDL